MSTVYGPDPEHNFHLASQEMELAGHPPRKIAKRKHPQPDEPSLLSDE
jgi:hypothetical protein